MDLAFHEASHFFTSFLPRVIYFAGGSIGQIVWPLGIGVAFLLINKDLLGGGLCFAWAGTAAQNVSIYIADAPHLQLDLIGGLHDWNTILGPEHINKLGLAEPLSRTVWTGGLLLWVTGVALCASGPWVMRRRAQREVVEAAVEAAPPPGSHPKQPASPDAGWAVVPPWESGNEPPPEGEPPAARTSP